MAESLLAGIDVGTTKTLTLLAQLTPDAGVEVLGMGSAPSTGLRKGLVLDPARTVRAIRDSVAQAERESGERIGRVCVGVTGSHLLSHPASAEVTVTNPDRGVSPADIARVMELVKARDFGSGRQLVAALVQEYICDGAGGIRTPLGRPALKLGVKALLISGETTHLETLHQCLTEAGLEVEEFYLQPVASGEAVLSADDMDRGTVLIDIGGGTTDIAVYHHGAVVYTFVVPVGGDHFDSDLAYAFELQPEQAEWLKISHGSVLPVAFASTQVARLPFPQTELPFLPEKLIAEVVYPRAAELCDLILQGLQQSGCSSQLRGGCVLTGGGSQLTGLPTMTHDLLGIPARIGHPSGVVGRRSEDLRSPSLATGIGLLHLAARQREREALQHTAPVATRPGLTGLLYLLGSGPKRIWERLIGN